MRLVGPWPCIANGKVRLSAKRSRDGLTLILQDESHTGLDEVSIRMVGISEADGDAFEQAVKAFNAALAIAKAKEAA